MTKQHLHLALQHHLPLHEPQPQLVAVVFKCSSGPKAEFLIIRTYISIHLNTDWMSILF